MSQICFRNTNLPLKKGHFSMQDTSPRVPKVSKIEGFHRIIILSTTTASQLLSKSQSLVF